MLRTTGSSVASAFRVDNIKVVGSSGSARAESGESVTGSDGSRKKSTKSKGQPIQQWAQLYITIRSTWKTRKVSTHPVNLREPA